MSFDNMSYNYILQKNARIVKHENDLLLPSYFRIGNNKARLVNQEPGGQSIAMVSQWLSETESYTSAFTIVSSRDCTSAGNGSGLWVSRILSAFSRARWRILFAPARCHSS